MKYTDPSGNIALEDDAIIALLCVVGGVSYYIYVNAAYLRTPKGKEKLNNVTEVICDGITYTVKKFKQKFSRELEWEAIAPPSVKLANTVTKSKGNTKGEKSENPVRVSKKAQKQAKKLSPEAKKGYDKALKGLKSGDLRGLNNHPLKGDRLGQWAIDINGTGQGRGNYRISNRT